MNYKRFEELPVWQEAIRLAALADDYVRSHSKSLTHSRCDQLERCSLSVSNNIAEGFEKETTPDLIKYLFIAKGSSGEVRSMCLFFKTRPYLSPIHQALSEIEKLAESCSNQLGAWIRQLKKI